MTGASEVGGWIVDINEEARSKVTLSRIAPRATSHRGAKPQRGKGSG